MKKIICLLLMMCCIFGGCSGTPIETTDPGKDPGTTTDPGTTDPGNNGDNPGGNTGLTSSATVSFSDKNADKVITEPTFDVSACTADAKNDIKTYEYFRAGMCLQREAINRIWGKASGTEHIAAEINGKVYYGTVKGREWEIYLPKMSAGGPYELSIISDKGRLTMREIYIGEVFLCTGQSNMEFQPQHVEDAALRNELYPTEGCKNKQIRMFQVGWSTPDEPSDEAIRYGELMFAQETTIPNFTAVGYQFGKQMQAELGCPIGLIANPVGDSSIEFWLSQENYEKVVEAYKPTKPQTSSSVTRTPSLGYNGMLYPLTGLSIRGVVWYQGESNAFGTERLYDKALKIYMDQCRELFDNEELLFTFCELARYCERPLAYSTVNEKINEVAAEDSHVAVARNLDMGEWNNIHPKDKRELGRRAAYETLRLFFKKDKPEPIKVVDYKFNDDGSVTINLSREAELKNGKNGFEVYVGSKYTYDCEVSIQGKQITVTADGEITKVRYGYTCEMTEAEQNDVSKMVTVYDDNGFPLDLFLIKK